MNFLLMIHLKARSYQDFHRFDIYNPLYNLHTDIY